MLTSTAGASAFSATVSSSGGFSSGTLQLEGTTAGPNNCYSTGTGSGGSVTVSNAQPCASGSPIPTGELSSTASSTATTTLTSVGRVNATSSTVASGACGVAQLADSVSATDWSGTGPEPRCHFSESAIRPLVRSPARRSRPTVRPGGPKPLPIHQSRDFHRARVAQDLLRREPSSVSPAPRTRDRPRRITTANCGSTRAGSSYGASMMLRSTSSRAPRRSTPEVGCSSPPRWEPRHRLVRERQPVASSPTSPQPRATAGGGASAMRRSPDGRTYRRATTSTAP